MERIIETRGLAKRYGEIRAVDGLDFYVEQGKLFAFLGPNGAGKSTTIDMLCTLRSPDAGEAFIDGLPLGRANDAIRAKIGVVFQESVLDKQLTVRENLAIRARMYPGAGASLREAVQSAARAACADSFLNRPYGKLSGGQRRRADIARALVNTPRLLFLDEPTTGLDPQTRASVWNTIADIQKEHGMTVFFSTHYMEEAAKADYILIIDKGKIAARGAPPELKERYAADQIRLFPRDAEGLKAFLAQRGRAFTEKGGLLLLAARGMEDTLSLLGEAAPLLQDFEVVRGTMDDVFLSVAGREVREDG